MAGYANGMKINKSNRGSVRLKSRMRGGSVVCSERINEIFETFLVDLNGLEC